MTTELLTNAIWAINAVCSLLGLAHIAWSLALESDDKIIEAIYKARLSKVLFFASAIGLLVIYFVNVDYESGTWAYDFNVTGYFGNGYFACIYFGTVISALSCKIPAPIKEQHY